MTLHQVHTNTHALAKARGKQLFYILVALIVFAFSIYVYFLGRTVFAVVVRKNIEKNIRTKVTAISELELAYLSKNNTIDPNLLQKEGYVAPEKMYFISRENTVGLASVKGYDL